MQCAANAGTVILDIAGCTADERRLAIAKAPPRGFQGTNYKLVPTILLLYTYTLRLSMYEYLFRSGKAPALDVLLCAHGPFSEIFVLTISQHETSERMRAQTIQNQPTM